MNICIIGLGYVGFPLAKLCANKKHTVYGIDLSKEKVDKVNKHIDPVEGGTFKEKIEASTDNNKFVKNFDSKTVQNRNLLRVFWRKLFISQCNTSNTRCVRISDTGSSLKVATLSYL